LYYFSHDSALHNKRQGVAACAVPRHIGGSQGIGGYSVACSTGDPGEKPEQAGEHLPVSEHEEGRWGVSWETIAWLVAGLIAAGLCAVVWGTFWIMRGPEE
jgi:hypothetical protein